MVAELSPIRCPSCRGSGKDRDYDCSVCAGVGLVTPYTSLRAWPCRKCGHDVTEGFIRKSGPNNSFRCAACYTHLGSISKQETGEPVRHVRSRVDLKQGQRERILARDNGFCLSCGRSVTQGIILHVGHMFSVADCKRDGFGPDVYNDDANLFAQCEECNLEQGGKSLADNVILRLLAARVMRRKNGWGE